MDDVKYFPYSEKELAYLRKKDKKLSAVIDRVGHIERAVDDDLFPPWYTTSWGNRFPQRRRQPFGRACRTPSARSMPNTF